MSNDLNFFVNPALKDARQMHKLLDYQGDMRAIVYADTSTLNGELTLVVFDSYGNTHTTMHAKLSKNGFNKWIQECWVFRKDGTILTDVSGTQGLKLTDIFKEPWVNSILYMYSLFNIPEPTFVDINNE